MENNTHKEYIHCTETQLVIMSPLASAGGGDTRTEIQHFFRGKVDMFQFFFPFSEPNKVQNVLLGFPLQQL